MIINNKEEEQRKTKVNKNGYFRNFQQKLNFYFFNRLILSYIRNFCECDLKRFIAL